MDRVRLLARIVVSFHPPLMFGAAPVHVVLGGVQQKHQAWCHGGQREQEQAGEAVEIQDQPVGRQVGQPRRVRFAHAGVAVVRVLHRRGVHGGMCEFRRFRGDIGVASVFANRHDRSFHFF